LFPLHAEDFKTDEYAARSSHEQEM